MHRRERFINIAVEELDAENLASRRSLNEHRTSNIERRISRAKAARPACERCENLNSSPKEFASPFGVYPRSVIPATSAPGSKPPQMAEALLHLEPATARNCQVPEGL